MLQGECPGGHIDIVEEEDGVLQEVRVRYQETEAGQRGQEAGQPSTRQPGVPLVHVVLRPAIRGVNNSSRNFTKMSPVIIEDNRLQQGAAGQEGEAAVRDGHLRVGLGVEYSEPRTREAERGEELVRDAGGELEGGQLAEAAHEAEQLRLEAGLAAEVQREVERGDA